MKKIAITLMILLCFMCVFAEDSSLRTLGSASKIITAYKRKLSGDVPDSELQIRFLDSDTKEFTSGYNADLPLNARQTAYSAFTWVLSGNIYGSVNVKFTFGPMYLEDNTSSSVMIPYDIELKHTRSRIGNTPIAVNKVSGASSYITNSFTTYKFKYADKVTGTGSTSITNSNKSVTVGYDMSTYTVVKTAGGADTTYSLGVCDYWNRYGEAVVTLNITAAGNKVGTSNKFNDGVYYANVKVELIVN